MKGISLEFNEQTRQLSMVVDMSVCDEYLQLEKVKSFLKDSEYRDLLIYEGSLRDLVKTVSEAQEAGVDKRLEFQVGETKPTEIKVNVSDDEMTAYITLIGAYGGRTPRLEDFHQALALNGVVRGVSHKLLSKLLKQAPELEPGQEITHILAKGLPPRQGKPTRVVSRIETPMERILKPKENPDGSVDMRELGEVLSVNHGDLVAEIKPPTFGRNGFTVTHEVVPGIEGAQKNVTLGSNTELDKKSPHLIRATIAGQPKFYKGVMSVQTVLELKGVNVRTGNIKYNGAVLVKGDVAESMQIDATGDVIVEGFVESAKIKTDGDIIVSQGCSGSADALDCVLEANGNVSIQHGQGCNIKVKGNLNVGRQLAHSKVECCGHIFVGRGKVANGSLFACTVHARGAVRSGNIGAISGSKLDIDFTQGYQLLVSRMEVLQGLREELASTNADHLIRYSKMNTPSNRKKALEKMQELEDALESEQLLLQWLIKVEDEMQQAIRNYRESATVIAMKTFFPNVIVTLDTASYTTSGEYKKSAVLLKEDGWKQMPYKGR